MLMILKRNFILHVLNVVKCTLKTGTRAQSYKGGCVKKKANFCDVRILCLDIVFDVDSNK